LTAVVEVDVAVVLEPIVDLDVASARRSTCKVDDGVELNVAVDVKGWVKVIVDVKVNSDG
jgi:hypothetical protein